MPLVDDESYAFQIERRDSCASRRTPLGPSSQTETGAQMNTIDTEIAWNYAQISWHYAQIAWLKATRNTIAPIFRLPNELLSRILTIYAVDSDSLFNLRWTDIIYVCRHWRDLALAAHPLWSFIDICWTPMTRKLCRLHEQLRRSGLAPVTLKIAFCDSPTIVQSILANSERIYALELTGEAQQVHNFIVSLPNHRFPILSSLLLEPNHKRDELPGGVLASFPQSALEGGIPNLRALRLTEISLPWSSLRGLETLSLTKCNDTSSQPLPTFASVLEMLGASPQLQSLRLDRVISPPLYNQDYPCLELPMLTSIRIDDDVTACTALLNHLWFPPTTTMLIYPTHVNTGADVRELLIPLRKQIRAAAAPTIGLLAIQCHGTESLVISAHHEASQPELLNRDPPLLLTSSPHTENALRQIMSKIIKAIPFEYITHLDARLAPHPTPASWRTALKLLPALEMVYLMSHNGAASFLRALLEIELDERRRATHPRLRCLHLIAIVWDAKQHETIALILDLLTVLLTQCRSHGRALPVFEIDERENCLGRHEEKVAALPVLVGERMVRNGREYDPVKTEQERERLMTIWRAGAEADEAAALDTAAGPSS